MGNPNDLAMNMVTFLPLAVVIAITKGRTLPRVAAGVIAALMMATILFTKSRAGLLGLAAALVVLVIEGRRLRPGLGVAALRRAAHGRAPHAVLVLGPDREHHQSGGRTSPDRVRRAKT